MLKYWTSYIETPLYIRGMHEKNHVRAQNNSTHMVGKEATVRCVTVRIQALTAIMFFPGGQESSIYSPTLEFE